MRDGQVVPLTQNVTLYGGGVKLQATMLYSDLAASTRLAMWDRRVAARIFKAFLSASSRIIRAHDGYVRSFDGDRVMGVFLGDRKNTNAAKCALKINWMFREILYPKFKKKFEKIDNGAYALAHGTGVDTSEVLVVRGGLRNDNDLLWIGRAPNIAAKLSGIRDGLYASWVTGEVYDKMLDEAKFGGQQKTNMWEERVWTNQPVTRVFRSSWKWKP
jgi:class 3 adenylate cyclase